jgi:dTDP-4-dehydrorhamnose 3,5-epimerase
MHDYVDTGISRQKIATRTIYPDARGHFAEVFRNNDHGVGLPNFVQDNVSYSMQNVLRGMHFQDDQWQILTVLVGSIVDVTIDIDETSSTFLATNVVEMKIDSNNQLIIPPGVAHGFCVTSDEAVLHYKSSKYYGETKQYGIAWDSEQLRDLWPQEHWILSERDLNFPHLSDLKANVLKEN